MKGMMREREKDRDKYLKSTLSTQHMFPELWELHSQLNFQNCIMCFYACARLCSRLRCGVQSRVRPPFTQRT